VPHTLILRYNYLFPEEANVTKEIIITPFAFQIYRELHTGATALTIPENIPFLIREF
jgi:hypothetical protein